MQRTGSAITRKPAKVDVSLRKRRVAYHSKVYSYVFRNTCSL
ncbi:hypothetical protein CCONF_08455 [Corynebacterium confusum]|nr:hypothetical protein CCONF_08455 [Corynebacterium confusum]